MTSEVEFSRDREAPHFVVEWRAGFEPDGEDFTPLDYLSLDRGLRFTIAAQWLYCPNFVEYRGCVVVVKNGDDDGNLADQKNNVDHWYDYFHGDIPNTEAKANLFNIVGLFTGIEEIPYGDERYLPALARSVARCWRACSWCSSPIVDSRWKYTATRRRRSIRKSPSTPVPRDRTPLKLNGWIACLVDYNRAMHDGSSARDPVTRA
ncbi:MAG: hypothetical protein ACRDTG_01785 [Pseudonocardiaceae bacterium]